MTTPSQAGGQRPPIPTMRLSVASQHAWPNATASRETRSIKHRRDGERPSPADPSSLCRDQPNEFMAHLALALTRYARHLRQDRLSVPPAIDELAALVLRCARARPTTTRVDDEEPRTQGGAVVRQLLLTKAEAAESLRVSVRTVERLIASGQLPLLHVEGASRLRLADVEAYVDSLSQAESAPPRAASERAGSRRR
jgi:excisionase family DNA binding protein